LDDLSGSIPVNIFNMNVELEYICNTYNEARKFLGMTNIVMYLYILIILNLISVLNIIKNFY
jgi:hypothetical protein